MKLFIYDKFWDAFLKINKGTQSKVTDFISKFRTDSKSAAINLELGISRCALHVLIKNTGQYLKRCKQVSFICWYGLIIMTKRWIGRKTSG